MSDHSQTIEEYQRNGIVRMRDFFSTETVVEIRAELERYIRDDLSSKPADACTYESDGLTVRNLWRLEQARPESSAHDTRSILRSAFGNSTNGSWVQEFQVQRL